MNKCVSMQQNGFSMIELMAVVTIAAVLIGTALPSYQNMIKNNCLTTKANSLIGTFTLARSEGVKRRANVMITATNAAAGSNKWGTGWTVWQDTDGDATLDNGEAIRVVQLACVTTTVDNATTQYLYDNRGFSTLGGGDTFNLCDDRTGERGRQISLSTIGRPSIDSNYICP